MALAAIRLKCSGRVVPHERRASELEATLRLDERGRIQRGSVAAGRTVAASRPQLLVGRAEQPIERPPIPRQDVVGRRFRRRRGVWGRRDGFLRVSTHCGLPGELGCDTANDVTVRPSLRTAAHWCGYG